jgi:hypothetical protein
MEGRPTQVGEPLFRSGERGLDREKESSRERGTKVYYQDVTTRMVRTRSITALPIPIHEDDSSPLFY